MNRFLRLTLKNIPIFAALFIALAALGYLIGDLRKPSAHQWLSLIVIFPATVLAISALSAGQELLAEWRERRRRSNKDLPRSERGTGT
jgi:hypothetical protein